MNVFFKNHANKCTFYETCQTKIYQRMYSLRIMLTIVFLSMLQSKIIILK